MIKKTLIYIAATLVLISCKKEVEWDYSIIPQPAELQAFHASGEVKALVLPSRAGLYQSAIESIEQMMVWKVEYSIGENSNVVINKLEKTNEGGSDFSVEVDHGVITIDAYDEEGVKMAMSRLMQLQLLNGGVIPPVSLSDVPRFNYRGMHLDVGRHFFSVEDIKKYIDYLFIYGYNTFHWHLTEDQGWRIEIKKYPKLQEIAAYREETLKGHYNDQPHQFDGIRYGGFYTQEEVKEVVSYAYAKGVEVIPEIELPGHSLAALAAYPELGCEDKEYKVGTKWGVYDDIYCPTENTFEFLQDVLDEVIELFPSTYIHIGGDEAPKRAWKESKFCQALIRAEGLGDEHGLQSYFISRIEEYLNSKGRQIIGWDEILEGGLAPNATVMSWRGISGGIEAAQMGHKVIMTPTSHCYFDYYQSDHPDEPLAIGGYLPVKKVYNYEPIPEELDASQHELIIGAQGNVWTEYLKEFKDIEYMALARMMALSEVLWLDPNEKDYDRFIQSLANHSSRWSVLGVNIANHIYDVNPFLETEKVNGTMAILKDFPPHAEIEVKKPLQDQWTSMEEQGLKIDQSGNYFIRAITENIEGRPYRINYTHHKGTAAEISLSNLPAERYSGNGPATVINGVKGSDEKYGDKEWLGFEGTHFEGLISFSEKEQISNIGLRFFKGEGQWIYLPSRVAIFGSEDGKDFTLIAEDLEIDTEEKVATLNMPINETQVNFLKVVAENYGVIPEGRQGAGHKSWLFIDEITID